MQIKWKCLLQRVLLPIIITVVVAIIMMVALLGGAWIYYEVINPNYTLEPQHYTYDRNAEIGRSIMMYSMPFWFILLIVFIISWMREAVKPCIIKEDTHIDKIAWGFGAFLGFIQFLSSMVFAIMGIIMILPCAAVTISILTGRYSDIPIGIFAYIFIIVMFLISWIIYPYGQTTKVEIDEDDAE